MTHATEDGTRCRYEEKMGPELGAQFYLLFQEVAWLHLKWTEFADLFGLKPSRIDLLNQAAPAFFRIVQDALWEDIVLHIARLTDPSKSLGKKANLTICNLPSLIIDQKIRADVAALVGIAIENTGFCRDWRNRHIAHRDLSLALESAATPLAPASRKQTHKALSSIKDVLNALEAAYMNSHIYFDALSSLGGAISLLHVLDDGMRAKAKRSERLSRGEWSKEDLPRDL
jgi:AbiU2